MLPAWHPILPFTAKCDTTFDRHRLATIRYFFYWYIYYPYIMHTHLSVRFFNPAARIRAYFFGVRITVLLWVYYCLFYKNQGRRILHRIRFLPLWKYKISPTLLFLCTSPTLLLLIYGRGPPIGWLPYLLYSERQVGSVGYHTYSPKYHFLIHGLLPLRTSLHSKNALKTLKNAGFCWFFAA